MTVALTWVLSHEACYVVIQLVLCLMFECFSSLREEAVCESRTETDTDQSKAKLNKTKQNRGVNVQCIVYVNVECDSMRL